MQLTGVGMVHCTRNRTQPRNHHQRIGRRAFLLAVATILALALVDKKATAEDAYPLKAALTTLLGDRPLSREDRKVIATGLAAACRELNGKIPSLSPRESDWVDGEIKAGRTEAIYRTAEFAKRQTKRTLSGCENTAKVIGHDLPEMRELALWAHLLRYLIDENLEAHIENLKRSKIVNAKDADRSGISVFLLISRLIVDKIVAPGLMDAASRKH